MKARRRRKRPVKAVRTPTDREDRQEVGPTPETAQKARTAPPDPIAVLVEQGLVSISAVNEIRDAHDALTHKQEARISSYSNIAHGQADISEKMDWIVTNRYLPWCRAMGSRVLDFVMPAIIEGVGVPSKGIADAIEDYSRRMVIDKY